MVKYIIGAALATGLIGISLFIGVGIGTAIGAAGTFGVYRLNSGRRVVAYFLMPKTKIPDRWSEAKEMCHAYMFIDDDIE